MQIEKESNVYSESSTSAKIVPRGQNLLNVNTRTIFPYNGAIGYDTTTPDQLYVGDGIVWHPLGGTVDIPYAYAYLYSLLLVEGSYEVAGNTGITTGVIEFQTVDIEFSTSGSFVYEQNSGIPGNITGVQVPIEGDYSIEWSVTGTGIEGGLSSYSAARDGIITPGGGNAYSTVTGHSFETGSEFESFITSTPLGLITGSFIMNLAPVETLRIVNAFSDMMFLVSQGGVNPVISSLKIILLRPT
jgi:hypothetical protein